MEPTPCSEHKNTHMDEIECANCFNLICGEMSYSTNNAESLCYRCYFNQNVKHLKYVVNKKAKLHQRDETI